jgi:FAD/FMN-containing dehydrogenase/Fe-S oxidoreductase
MWEDLKKEFSGELYYDDSPKHNAIRMSYATDASVYQERPLAVAIPKTNDDIKLLIQFAGKTNCTLIPRAAGTSLAGQVVGSGIVVDISKYFTSFIEINTEEKWVRVQPGVIRDDLNVYLRQFGLMFGPETSTSNRAMIGGMIGNNSCGLHSIIWGAVRENLHEVKAFLADGSEVIFKDVSKEEFESKCEAGNLEGEIYRSIRNLLGDPSSQKAINEGFPKKSITRRNTGYALDSLLNAFQFENDQAFNFCKLIAGSEGTLCFITEAKLKLQPLPPKEKCVVAVHTHAINEALQANLIALQHHCAASELVDDIILEYTKTNIDQSKNRFFVVGNPRAILMVEFFGDTKEAVDGKASYFIEAIRQQSYGYAYPVLYGAETNNAWELRKAGLGLLRNEPGNTQPVNLIEDCAVSVEDLPDYINDLEALLKKYNARYSMYAHAGAGELHVEPMLNLKTSSGKILFKTILQETAAIVKKYNGSLSGEHGDGRLRGEFIPFMMGEKNYELFRQVKNFFDPACIFNKGKIVDTPLMNEFLRYVQDADKKEVKTVFDFTKQEGILHLAEKCSGSGDCRKTHISGGTMCPSYMATRSEKDTTRARANMLRHFYTKKTYGNDLTISSGEVKNVLDLCLSCKGCKSECPSSVDVGKMKAEFTQEYYDKYGASFRSKLIGNFSRPMKLAAIAPWAYNAIFGTASLRRFANKMVGFHPNRTMPLLYKTTLRKWFANHRKNHSQPKDPIGTVYLFCDEFTNYNDVEIGIKAVLLLEALGYGVRIPEHVESGRTYLSKGFVRKAKEIANKNVELLKDVVNAEAPIIGIEPSAILTLRDEYPELVCGKNLDAAKQLAVNSFLFEEWFSKEIEKGKIRQEQFKNSNAPVYLHGHCYQKSLSSTKQIKRCLTVVSDKVEEIPSGCCGMAGAFGYEKEHYDVSMQIGSLVLFPTINKLDNDAIMAASGTSCRHQIKDGTGRIAKHTAEILYEALAAGD